MTASYVNNWGEFQHEKTPYFSMIDNYIYSYHTDTLIIIPTFPESLADSISNQYNQTPILGRSAPIYAFSNAGPRTVQIDLKLHRDMMNQVNVGKSSINYGFKIFEDFEDDEYRKKLLRNDYMELLIKELQSIALPNYIHGAKMIDPPLIAIRFGDELFCKGIVDGGVSVNYSGPILANPLYNADGSYQTDATTKQKLMGKGKYATADISFKVTEVIPYDAQSVAQLGSFRGLDRTLERNLYRSGG